MTVNNPDEVPQHDIEMLEIPDDSSVSSNDLLDSSSGSNRLKLQDWLETLQRMEFKFDPKQYEESLTQSDDFSKHYTEYVTSLYKVIENLGGDDLDSFPQDSYDEEPLGVVIGTKGRKVTSNSVRRDEKIDDAFSSFMDILQTFIDKIDEEHEDISLFYRISNIFDCLQAINFSSLSQQTPELVSRWINRYELKPENELVETVMLKTPTPYLHPQFWNTYLAQLLTRGLIKQAFEAVSNSGYEELKEPQPQVYDLIKDFETLIGSYTSMAVKGQFPKWKLSACETRDLAPSIKDDIEDAKFQLMVSQVYDLLCIITGLPKTIASYCDSWYEIFTALSFFQVRDNNLFKNYYDISTNEIPPPVADAVLEEDDEEAINLLTEQCFSDVLEEKFVNILTAIDKLDLASAAYVSRLFELKGLLKSYYQYDIKQKVNDYMSQRTISEYLLTIQAYQCLNTHDLVPVGIGLLLNESIAFSSQSIIHNRKTIENFLPLYHYLTNDDLEWGLTICATLNLVNTAKELYYSYGLNSLREGYLYEGINMLVNCYEQHTSTETSVRSMKEVHRVVWDIIFHESLVNSRLFDDELINNVVLKKISPDFEIHPVIRQCLAPYAVLAEYYVSKSEQSASISKLIHLLRFQHLPKKFCLLLLCQFLGCILKTDVHLPEMIMVVEIIDNYYLSASKDERAEGEVLYQEALQVPEDDAASRDWRKPLTDLDEPIPNSADGMIKLLRNVISCKIAELYIK